MVVVKLYFVEETYQNLTSIRHYLGYDLQAYQNGTLLESMLAPGDISIEIIYDIIPILLEKFNALPHFQHLGLITTAEIEYTKDIKILLRNSLSRILFQPSDSICRFVKNYTLELRNHANHLIGYQMRFGGTVANHQEPSQFLLEKDVQMFYRSSQMYMHRNHLGLKDVSIFVSTDSDVMANRVLSFYHNESVFTMPGTTRGHSSPNALNIYKESKYLENTIKELFILKNCDHLVTTMYSSFGDFVQVLRALNNFTTYRGLLGNRCDSYYSIEEETSYRPSLEVTLNRVNKNASFPFTDYQSYSDFYKFGS